MDIKPGEWPQYNGIKRQNGDPVWGCVEKEEGYFTDLAL